MAQLCSRCQRANPDGAVFCYFDGGVLENGAVGAVIRQLPQEFAFPSGRKCRTFEDLVQGCYTEWEDARELLRKGEFTRYLGRIGRADLSRVAQEAQTQPDADIALVNFLAQMPAGNIQGPKLDLYPRRIIIGPVRVGEQRPVQLTVNNQGKGLLQGKLKIVDAGNWLTIPDGLNGQTPIRAAVHQQVMLTASAFGLVAGQSYSAKLTVVSNGGIAEVPLRFDVQAMPFPRAPYQGAMSARELAERMKVAPKPGIALLENGEIARWFQANGWTFPIVGATAPGVAAVQQFFEGLGLSKAPPLVLSDTEILLRCKSPESVQGQVILKTSARKWVYAHAESDSPWLRLAAPRGVSGQQQAVVAFEVDSAMLDRDGSHVGQLHILANGGQRFTVRVRVEVTGVPRTWSSRKSASLPAIVPAGGENLPSWLDNAPETPSPARPTPPPVPASTVRHAPLISVQPATPPPEKRPSTITNRPKVAPIEPPRLPSRAPSAGVVQALVVGALVAFLVRLILIFPADLWARALVSGRTPAAGTLEAWMEQPGGDEVFFRLFVLATWWVGALVGMVLVRQHGGGFVDLLRGAIAGSFAGLGVAATLASAMTIIDGVPRSVLRIVSVSTAGHSVFLGTVLWCSTALFCWTLLGAFAGLTLGVSGQSGKRLLALLCSPVAWTVRLCGMRALADYFSL
jgi:hypothetical protein